MTDRQGDLGVLAVELSKPTTGWSLGSFGAIAEFVRDPDEPVTFRDGTEAIEAVTARGGIRIRSTNNMRLFASESATTESWNHRVSICLPKRGCAMHRRTVLTELGPDEAALRLQDRRSILFDLGLDALQVDACIRVADAEVIARLRECVGTPVFDRKRAAMDAILQASPHRVFISRVGRIEVFQPIPSPDGRSPEGPHTHVLPKLLQHKRTHAATEPVPAGWVPCAHFYPAHPVRLANGKRRPFDPASHREFQTLLSAYGDANAIMIKHHVCAAVRAGEDPAVLDFDGDRYGRMALRVTLRQLLASEGPSASLAAWLTLHDRAGEGERGEADLYGH